MTYVIGVALLALIIFGVRWWVTTPPHLVLQTLKWATLIMAIAATLVLLVTGRYVLVPLFLCALFFWSASKFRMFKPGGRLGAKIPPEIVETDFLAATLDPDGAIISGFVKAGLYQGRSLYVLSLKECLELYRECRIDPPSRRLMERWLDDLWPDWRDDRMAAFASDTHMSRDEALEILQLEAEPADEAIIAAHRRRTEESDPVHQGAPLSKERINEARNVLLKL